MSTEIAIRKQIEETIAGQDASDYKPHVEKRSWGYVNDQQNGVYSNQVSFDLTSAMSTQGYAGLQESFIAKPYMVKLESDTAFTGAVPPYAVALKNNISTNLIDSVQLFVNQQQLIDQTTFTNFPVQLMDAMTMSSSNQKLVGSMRGVSPDTATSIRVAGAGAAVSGDGVVNNLCWQTAVADRYKNNEGLADRTQMFPTVNTDPTVAKAGLQPYFSNDGTTAKVGIWNFVAIVPLRRISDLLSKYPLVKGSQIRLVINFNAGISTYTCAASTGNMALSSVNMTAGNTFPAMVLDKNVSGLVSSSGTATVTLTAKIQSTSASPVTNTSAGYGYPALPQCRVYIPQLRLNPTYEERILANRVKTIRYLDWYQYNVQNVANGSTFSNTLTTALPNTKILIGVPFRNTSSGVFATASVQQFQSPFDTAPATTYPAAIGAFTNFNVQVNGVNILAINGNYSFDFWTQQIQKFSLNGGLSKELSSGLLDFRTWNNSPIVAVDLSDRPESSEDTYQSITTQGLNNSGVAMNYYWFVGFEKKIEVDCITGDVKKLFG